MEELAPMMSSMMTMIMTVIMIQVVIQVISQILLLLRGITGEGPAPPQPTVSINPTTIRTTETFTCTWSGFKDGYWVYLKKIPEGIPYWGLGRTGSGTIQCHAPPNPGTYNLRAEQPDTGLYSNTVTLTVTT